jgi:hypothetical protein
LNRPSNYTKDFFVDLVSAMRQTDAFRDSLLKNLESYKREHGSEILSNLDKVVTNCFVNSKYIIKIYFADIMNIVIKSNVREYNKVYARK